MNRVFSVGPIETADGEGYLVTLMRGELAAGVESGPTALEALRAIVERTRGEILVASPELREEARVLGLEVAPLPESIQMFRASQAFLLANGGCFEGKAGYDSARLISAVIDYLEAAPWRWLDGDTPVRIEYERRGQKAKTLEASVLGNASELFGLALYDRPGCVAKLARPGASPTDHDVVLLTLDDEPSWAVGIMRESYGLPFVPTLARVRRNQMGLVHAGDLIRLEGTLRAVAQLEPGERASRAEFVDAEGRATIVRATIPAPALATAPSPRVQAKISRNAMCPCGSGRKYKRCCLPKDELDEQAIAYVDAERARTESLVDRLVEFMKREEADHALRWFERLIPGVELAEDYLPVLIPMLLYELPLRSGELLARRFLARDRRRLTADDRGRLEASVAARFSIWEVLRIDAGRGLELVDMLTGERCFVHDIMASRTTTLRAGLLARIVEHRGRRELDGSHPNMLRPSGTDAVVKAVRKHLGVRQKWVARERLLDPEASVVIFQLWQAELGRESATTVELVNTDDEQLEYLHDRFALLADHEMIVDALRGLPGMFEREVDEAGTRELVVLREADGKHGMWGSTTIGRIELRETTLSLQTNSRARADNLRDAVEGRLGLLARYEGRELDAAPSVGGSFGGRLAVESQPLGPYAIPEPTVYLALHLRHWRHEPNLQLDGLTPCEAVARAGARRKLHALLREHEYASGETGREVVAAMRAEIGLDELGERARVTDEIRMTAKISMRLCELATPLLMRATKDAEAEAILRVAAEVWNAGTAAGDGEVDPRKMLDRARVVLDEHELEIDARELEAWVDMLVPLRRHYDDPRYMEIAEIEFGERSNLRVAALLPRRRR